MKVLSIGLACLIAGALAAPVQEQAQNSQVQPHAPHEAPLANPMAVADPPVEEDPEFDGPEGPEEDDEDFAPEMMMVGQVPQGNQAAEQAMNEQSVTTGASRRALPVVGDLLGGLNGKGATKKHENKHKNKDGDKRKHKHKHDDDDETNIDIDIDNETDIDIDNSRCNNNQKAVCCNGLLDCNVIPIVHLVGIGKGDNCNGQVFCCDTEAEEGVAINIQALNCFGSVL